MTQTPTTKTTHTPGPWHVGGATNIVGADGSLVTSVPRGKGAGASARRDTNAALIVEAVNNFDRLTREHAEMMDALKFISSRADRWRECQDKANATLARLSENTR